MNEVHFLGCFRRNAADRREGALHCIGGLDLIKEYNSPKAELIEFDEKDVITTSPDNSFTGDTSDSANQSEGWSGLY